MTRFHYFHLLISQPTHPFRDPRALVHYIWCRVIMPVDALHISQHWDAATIILSYVISVTGSFCTIQLMEQWRFEQRPRKKRLFLFIAAVVLGGGGIWSMHFTGMNALQIRLENGEALSIDFEAWLTILSFILAVGGVLVGLLIASRDPFFLELEREKRAQLLAANLRKMNMTQLMKKESAERNIRFTAMFSRLWRICFGGIWTALGVLGMHYTGMLAQRTNLSMTVMAPFVVLSCIVAFVTANAAFWIIFRLLPLWPSNESLRFVSALIMGIAVSGTHYSGMAAAAYEYSPINTADTASFVVKGSSASTVASHGSLLFCFWISGFYVIRPLRAVASKFYVLHPGSTVHSDGATVGPNPSQSGREASETGRSNADQTGPRFQSAQNRTGEGSLSPSAAAVAAYRAKRKTPSTNMQQIMPN
uniref:Uncharacterized protein AlNc14C205G8795 n=1 Tax=Albugo laibachii Nc14 TaxID=890382 RepID=F0WQY7_9STRA|nr:conserved hypothetical protein [Albugo laibachii Nc14]|eukprot:CCA23747.1 conserved hypothetical protein [Albugo laibachii Nc14]